MIIIIMRGENFMAHLDGLGGTPVCRRTPVAHHCSSLIFLCSSVSFNLLFAIVSFCFYFKAGTSCNRNALSCPSIWETRNEYEILVAICWRETSWEIWCTYMDGYNENAPPGNRLYGCEMDWTDAG
jgi:hypothetical protein